VVDGERKWLRRRLDLGLLPATQVLLVALDARFARQLAVAFDLALLAEGAGEGRSVPLPLRFRWQVA
jgi:hypothetical protein